VRTIIFHSNTTTIEGQVISSKISFDPIDLPSDGYVTLTFTTEYVSALVPHKYEEITEILQASGVKVGINN